MSINLDPSLLLRQEYAHAILQGIATMFELTALAWLLAAADRDNYGSGQVDSLFAGPKT